MVIPIKCDILDSRRLMKTGPHLFFDVSSSHSRVISVTPVAVTDFFLVQQEPAAPLGSSQTGDPSK
jgi:hypothetical protein